MRIYLTSVPTRCDEPFSIVQVILGNKSFWSDSPVLCAHRGHAIFKYLNLPLPKEAWVYTSHQNTIADCESSNVKCSHLIYLEIRLVFPWRMSYHKSPVASCFSILIPKYICNCFPSGTAVPGRDEEHHLTLQL